MGIVRLMAKGTARDLAETHPQLRGLRQRLAEKYKLHPERAKSLVVSLVEHVANDLGDTYLGEMGARLHKIESIRGRIAGAIDHVIAEGALPPELDHAALTGLFDDLQKEMSELRSVSKFAETHQPKVDLKPKDAVVEPVLHPTSGDPFQGHVAKTPLGPLREAMAAIEQSAPVRAKAFWAAFDKHGDEIADAVLAVSETNQNKALAKLKDKLAPDEFEAVSETVKELSTARHKASIGPGSATARLRAVNAAHFPDELRLKVLDDNTILGPLAEQHPNGLRDLWDAWNNGGRKGGGGDFRNYVYGEMRSGTRPYLAEFEAAHGVFPYDPKTHGTAGLLKDPAAYDPRLPNMRKINPREGGTDLIGLREDGEIWVVDDKSHRLSKSELEAGQVGKTLYGVSAYEGRQLLRNLEDDVAEMKGALERLKQSGVTPEPAMEDAVQRLDKAVGKLKDETAGWSEEAFNLPDNRRQIAAVLGEFKVKLKVTSTMGDIRDVSEALSNLGIDVAPTFTKRATP